MAALNIDKLGCVHLGNVHSRTTFIVIKVIELQLREQAMFEHHQIITHIANQLRKIHRLHASGI